MKKLIYSLFAILALSCTFVACSDDDTEGAPVSQTPASDCSGTYSGTWTVDSVYAIQVSTGRGDNLRVTGDTIEGTATIPGTAVITPDASSAYVATLGFHCSTILNTVSPVNISTLADHYAFENSNITGENGLIAKFRGKSSNPIAFMGTVKDNTLETSFTMQADSTVGTRRSSTIMAWTYKFTFKGTRAGASAE